MNVGFKTVGHSSNGPCLHGTACTACKPVCGTRSVHLFESLLHEVQQRSRAQVHAVELVVLACLGGAGRNAPAGAGGEVSMACKRGSGWALAAVFSAGTPRPGSCSGWRPAPATATTMPAKSRTAHQAHTHRAPKAMTGTSSAPASSATLTKPRRRFSTKSRQPRCMARERAGAGSAVAADNYKAGQLAAAVYSSSNIVAAGAGHI